MRSSRSGGSRFRMNWSREGGEQGNKEQGTREPEGVRDRCFGRIRAEMGGPAPDRAMPAAMASKGIVAGRHWKQRTTVIGLVVLKELRREPERRHVTNPRGGLCFVFYRRNRGFRSVSLPHPQKKVREPRNTCSHSRRLQRLRSAGPNSHIVRCFKAPNWVHCPRRRRRKRLWARAIPEPESRAAGGLPARTYPGDVRAASCRFRRAPVPVPSLWCAPSRPRIPVRTRCNRHPQHGLWLCKAPAFRSTSLVTPSQPQRKP